MKNTIQVILKWISNIIVFILTYVFLMIDRQILVPFQWISSYNAEELYNKPDRYSTFAILRVTIALTILGLIFLFKIIF